jgi:hypothetical protein
MADELNLRQQRFIAEFMRIGVKSRAYAAAGYNYSTRESLDAASSQLFRNIKIKREIARRKRAMLKRSDITLEKLLSDAEDARKLAMTIDQPSAAKGASEFQAKLVGLLVERKESGAPGEFAGLTTPDAVIAAIRAEMGEDAANALLAMIGKPSAAPAPEPALPQEPEPEITATAAGSGSIN